MKKTLLAIVLVSLVACKQTTEAKKEITDTKETVKTNKKVVVPKTYPGSLSKIFKAHGGIDTWKSSQSFVFTMKKSKGNEITTTNLKNRKSLIQKPNHTIGFNGESVWLKSKGKAEYTGNAKFYYNLMFYFAAMPFILADDGIVYENVKPLEFEGKSYPGIKVSYNAGVGESPEDEYILYYDSKTNKMAWLAYTVTYFTKEKGKEYHFIKYSNWQTINGLSLPKTLDWYDYENNIPTKKLNSVKFTDIKLSKLTPNPSIFEAPADAKLIK